MLIISGILTVADGDSYAIFAIISR